MSDWVIIASIAAGVLLLAGLVHGIVQYRRLLRQEESQTHPVMALSLAVWRQARRVAILLVGVTVILFGVLLIFLPGPASIVIPLGLAILAIEFTWARRWLRRLKVTLHLSARRSRRFWKRKKAATADSGVGS